jgi:phosphatidate phosphatase LPIN
MNTVKDISLAESAPALPSTPVQLPVKDVINVPTPASPEEPMAKRKFAKTLRLTSEQLVCRSCYLSGNATESTRFTLRTENA